jgi:Tol biopolymer transport system component
MKRWKSLLILLVMVLLFSVGCGAPATSTPIPPTATPVPPTPTPVGSQIVFVSDRDGNSEIYVMNADGSGQARLTYHEADDNWPSMSPDGTRIVFVSDRDEPDPLEPNSLTCWLKNKCNTELYMVNTDGTGLMRLTDDPGQESFPVWSPDGTQIAFHSNRDERGDVFVMNADGSRQTNLTKGRGYDFYPAWVPDRPQIVFLSARDGGFQFYVVNTDGSGLTMLDSGLPPSQLTPSQLRSWALTVEYQYYLYDGDSWKTIQDGGSALGEFPTWSPDGTQVAFHSNRDGNMEIYVMDANLSAATRLTNNGANDMFPTWSPDGSQIAFHSSRDGNVEIYVMNADGTNLRRLTDNPATDCLPGWYP